jgi:hypothetical protein
LSIASKFEGERVNKTEKIGLAFILLLPTLMFASISSLKAQASTENMKTFLDSEILGITIQVNATAETQPNQNITAIVSLKRQANIYVGYLNLSIFGFVNGTYKTLMHNMADGDFSLDDTPRCYNCTFTVPEQVWDMTYGEIIMTYNATYNAYPMQTTIRYENISSGFTMTHIENVYLANLQAQYDQLQQNYTSLQGHLTELDNTRSAVAVLAITSIFFVATTLYLMMRKPKDYYY